MKENIMAFTALGCEYPEFLSVNFVDDKKEEVEIHARGPKGDDGSEGKQVSLRIPFVLFELMMMDAKKNLGWV